VCLVLGLFGTLIDVPHAVRDVSPFEAVPMLPAEAMRWLPIVAIAVACIGLTVAGFEGLRRRDMA
jgi:ABC-2 type transport system permease protein